MKLKTLLISSLMSLVGLTASATEVWSGTQVLSDETGVVIDFSSFNLQRGDVLTITGSYNTGQQYWHKVQFYTVGEGNTKGSWFAETNHWFFSAAAAETSTTNDFVINSAFFNGLPADGKVYVSGFFCTITKIEATNNNGTKIVKENWSPIYYTEDMGSKFATIEAGDIIRFSGTRGKDWGNIQFQSTWGGDTWQKEGLNWQEGGWDLSESVSVVYNRNSADWKVKATAEGSYIEIGGNEIGEGTHTITAMIGETPLTLENGTGDIYKKVTLTAAEAAAIKADGAVLTISGEGVHVGWVDIYNPVTPKFQQTYIPESGNFDVVVSEELATFAQSNTVYLYGCEFSNATVSIVYAPTVKINSAAEYATFSYNEKLDLTGIEAYAVSATSTTSATLASIEGKKVAANTGMILYKAGGGAVRIPFTTDDTDAISNSLIGTATGAVVNPSNAYVLANKSDVVGFYKLKSGQTIAANKAYLTIAAGAREFIGFGENEVTSIADVSSKKIEFNDDIFDLQGRKVSQPKKGLYIVNGKKVVIK